MIHSGHLLTPARALHRVFLLALSASVTTARVATKPSVNLRFPPSSQCTRFLSTTIPRQRMVMKKPKITVRSLLDDSYVKNAAIPYTWIRLRDEETGSLSEPQLTTLVLSRLKKGYSLVMLSAPRPEDPKSPAEPICKIFDVKAEQAKVHEAEAEAKRLEKGTKTLELNWAIAPGDLGHKMKRMKEFLDKGYRVEMLLARKRGTRRATRGEAEALVEAVRESAESVTGTAEVKKAEGAVGDQLRMIWQGPKKKKEKAPAPLDTAE
ncbi:hypothetical protein GGR57DRAFT_61736 [Xylariaceae sp. FL1272]|nr:hypothetical protein GGR57DRAFT_61736 [Xylariaceae sp. FL1272]